MLRHLSCAELAIIVVGFGAAASEEGAPETPASPAAAVKAAAGSPFVDVRTGLPRDALLAAIATWLSSDFGLPQIDVLPRVALVPDSALVAIRYRAVLGGPRPAVDAGAATTDLVAVYGDRERTIYLPETWSGGTAAEVSVLVHEMVHHIQSVAGLTYPCPEEREKSAFAAQEAWLALFGGDLETAFEIDPLTLLVRTNCFY